MVTFDRGLDDEFVECLNMEYAKGGWWRAFVDDPKLFVAIRDNRLNVYYRGCSLPQIRCEAGAVVGQTHYKFVLRPSVDNPSRPSSNLVRWTIQAMEQIGELLGRN